MKNIKKELKNTIQLKKIADMKESAVKKLKKLTDDEENLGILADLDDENETEQDEKDVELENFLKNYSDIAGAKVSISKWEDEASDWAKVGEYSIRDFGTTADKIAKMYGGGIYKFNIRDSKGQYVKQFTQTFSKVAYPIKNQEQPIIETQPSINPIEVVKTIQEQGKETRAEMYGLMSEFVKTMGQMISQMSGQRQSILTNTEDLIHLKNLFQSNDNPSKSIDTLINMLRTGIELGGDLRASESNDDSILESIFKKVLTNTPAEKLTQSLMSINTGVNQKQIVNEKKVLQNEPKQEVKGMNKSAISIVAKLNINPEKIAKTFLESADEFSINLIANLHDDKEALKKLLFELMPDLSKYPDWSMKFIDCVITEIKKLEPEPEVKEDNDKKE